MASSVMVSRLAPILVVLLALVLAADRMAAQQPTTRRNLERLPGIFVTLYRGRIEPVSIEVPSRKFMLVVHNKDPKKKATEFVFEQIGTDNRSLVQLKQGAFQVQSKIWATTVELPPGRYRLLELGARGRASIITVRP